jgi:uncharacterized protein
MNIAEKISQELDVRPQQVQAAVALLDEGATVPFISRYRKEATGGLDDTQMRQLEARLIYLREMLERRDSILSTIEAQGKLSTDLKNKILQADTKTRLEDLYLPYKKKRRTKGEIAKEAGLEPLARLLYDTQGKNAAQQAQAYLNPDKAIQTGNDALDGARSIIIEWIAEDADLVEKLRTYVWERGEIISKLVKGKEKEGEKFQDYFDFSEKLLKIPSHRVLALLRGRKEGFLRLDIDVRLAEASAADNLHPCETILFAHVNCNPADSNVDPWFIKTLQWAWHVKIASHIEMDLTAQIRERAEEEAIRVFSENLRDLLLAAPAGNRVTMGLDPGLRTGVKLVVVDGTGKLLAYQTIFPHAPRKQWNESIEVINKLATLHKVDLVSIGNGTASRETSQLMDELRKKYPSLALQAIVVSEAGASVYSASEQAAKEFPDLDVTYRGAVSIARRLQDPLAELVKIDPKAIGVGQYQHDVSQFHLKKMLENIVEDCVNAVGVDLNTASAALLAKVSGLSSSLAEAIVAYRDQHGAFTNRKQIMQVARVGPKVFEQCAGFMRIRSGDNPLDASAVHPEAYPLVEKIIASNATSIEKILGDIPFLSKLAANDFIDAQYGEPTVKDVIEELKKPGRDPRPEFKTAQFKEGIEKPSDLKQGMILEGVVSNVTNFGAFVDIGVHQDGLVHISVLSNQYVKDPRDVVKAGDVVKVKVMDIDLKRNRIALSMRLDEVVDRKATTKIEQKTQPGHKKKQKATKQAEPMNAMQEAFAKLKQ